MVAPVNVFKKPRLHQIKVPAISIMLIYGALILFLINQSRPYSLDDNGKGAVVMANSASSSMLRFEILLGIASAYGWPMNSQSADIYSAK
jgi:hypothetical protein